MNDVDVVIHGDCLSVLPTYPADFFDSCVTDPPYDLTSGKKGGSGVASVNLDSPYGRSRIGTGNGPGGFMGMAWDGTGIAFDPATWREVYRVLKPGAHLLAAGGSRTHGRLMVAIEDAGFEVRDCVVHLFGSGFPKSLDVAKAIDGTRVRGRSDSVGLREVNESRPGEATVRLTTNNDGILGERRGPSVKRATPITDEAVKWDGWGTALKPAAEFWVLARKPLSEKNVAANVLRWSVGALNVDACRVVGADGDGGATPIQRAATGGDDQGNVYGLREGVSDESVQGGTSGVAVDLWSTMSVGADARARQSELERPPLPEHTRLLDGAGPDGLSQLPLGTSSGDGANAESSAAADGVRASHRREQGKQSTGEPRRDDDLRSFAPAQGNFSRDGTFETESGRIGSSNGGGRTAPIAGRWPSNALLSHEPGCQIVGTREQRRDLREIDPKESANGAVYAGRREAGHGFDGGSRSIGSVNELAPVYECVESCAVRLLDEQSGERRSAGDYPSRGIGTGSGVTYLPQKPQGELYADSGGASRFFATFNGRDGEASAERRYTDEGSTNFAALPGQRRDPVETPSRFFYTAKADSEERNVNQAKRNSHPTVKPLALVAYLLKLVTPPGGTTLDCFAGSGTTGIAAIGNGFHYVLVEKEESYVEIAEQRIGLGCRVINHTKEAAP